MGRKTYEQLRQQADIERSDLQLNSGQPSENLEILSNSLLERPPMRTQQQRLQRKEYSFKEIMG